MKTKLQILALLAVVLTFNVATVQAETRSVAKNVELVAMKHDGRTVYVNAPAVNTLIEHGDSLAVSHNCKTVVGDLVPMTRAGRTIFVTIPAVQMHKNLGYSLVLNHDDLLVSNLVTQNNF